MPVTIDIIFPDGADGAGRAELEDALEDFFGDAAELVACGSGLGSSDVSFELADGEDPAVWAERVRGFLRAEGARRTTWLAVFPDGWDDGDPFERVPVYGPEP